MAVVFEQLADTRVLSRAGPLAVRLAGSPERIEAAQRLRHRVFAGECFMDRLRPIRGRLVEIGRSCVHPDYRSGGVIMLLWAGLGALLGPMRHRYVIGCASVSTADGGHFAASLHRQLAAAHGAPEEFRVFPKDRLPVEALGHGCPVVVPPLVKAYLRAGGQVIGEPHRDRDFDCADIPMLLAIDRLDDRYARRFVRGR